MKKLATALLSSVALSLFAGVASQAESEKISVPENYQSRYIRYSTVDIEGDKPKIRFLYANPEAIAHGKPGELLPYGTKIVMEDHKVKLDASGKPVKDAHGRMIPTNEIIAIIMQQKEKGWGSAISEDVRNVDWDFAIFSPDGTPREGINYKGCHGCHQRVEAQDYNFSLASFLERIKGEE